VVEPRRAHVGGGIEERLERAKRAAKSPAPQPAERIRAGEKLDNCACLGQQRSGLDRALTRSDYEHTAPGEPGEIGVVARVGGNLGGE
jgi:hypothetical protein